MDILILGSCNILKINRIDTNSRTICKLARTKYSLNSDKTDTFSDRIYTYPDKMYTGFRLSDKI